MDKKLHRSKFPTLLHALTVLLQAAWRSVKAWGTPRHLFFVAGITAASISLFFTAAFFLPRNVHFSVTGDNCITQPLLLPGLISRQTGDSYRATPQPSLSIGSFGLYSHRTCLEPTQVPKPGVNENIAFGNKLLQKRIAVVTEAFPEVTNKALLESPIATATPLALELSGEDKIFNYELAANNRVASCETRAAALHCDITKLELAQSATYSATLTRTFKGQDAGTVLAQQITTVQEVGIAASSVAPGQTVYDSPTELKLTLNREAITLDGAKLERLDGDARHAVPATFELQGTTITVRFTEPLPRSTAFGLTIPTLRAADGGFLAQAYVLPFTTSGGPKVTSVNIGTSKVDQSSNVVLTFDTTVKMGQTLSNFIKLEVSGKEVAANITLKGNKITIDPSAELPLCAQLKVRVLDGLQNEFGISGGSAWQRTSRVTCKATFSIGTSVKGRGITAYRFGSGASKVIFVGGTHGDEKSSVYALNSLADYLETNPDKIPAHRTIIIIPNLNPDGFAAGTRTNANNVDLNRNFPSNNWKQGVTMPGGSYNANGGGSAPLSEPESRALANYVLSQSPRLVLTYHAAAGVVIPNDSGDSDALAHIYDQKSNVGYASNSQTGAIFAYDTTGAFEDWLHDKHGIPTLLIELWTKTGNEFSKNQNAMLHMVQLP